MKNRLPVPRKITTSPEGANTQECPPPYLIQNEGQTLVGILLGVHSSAVVVLVCPAVALDKEIFEGHHVLLLVGHHHLIVEAEHDELWPKREGKERPPISHISLHIGSIVFS